MKICEICICGFEIFLYINYSTYDPKVILGKIRSVNIDNGTNYPVYLDIIYC